MTGVPAFDASAELLCYLVVGQLVARLRTNEWLRKDHLVESTRIWLAKSKQHVDPVDRVRIGQFSQQLAEDLSASPELRDPTVLARMFAGGGLDAQSVLVHVVRGICVARLR